MFSSASSGSRSISLLASRPLLRPGCSVPHQVALVLPRVEGKSYQPLVAMKELLLSLAMPVETGLHQNPDDIFGFEEWQLQTRYVLAQWAEVPPFSDTAPQSFSPAAPIATWPSPAFHKLGGAGSLVPRLKPGVRVGCRQTGWRGG